MKFKEAAFYFFYFADFLSGGDFIFSADGFV